MPAFNAPKLKVQIKLAINRLKLLQQKKTAGNGAARREIAKLLEAGKDDSARVRVEHIIREDFAIEAMEILELYCEMLLARFGLIEEMRHPDPAIREAVNTVIYAASKVDVKELLQVRDQLIVKFGKEFGIGAMENINGVVNERLVHKLRVSAPDPLLVDQYLKTIATAFNVEWDGGTLDQASLLDPIPQTSSSIPEVNFALPQQFPSDYQPPSVPIIPATSAVAASAAAAASNFSTGGLAGVDDSHPPAPGSIPPSAVPAVGPASANNVDFDELNKRFQALKMRK